MRFLITLYSLWLFCAVSLTAQNDLLSVKERKLQSEILSENFNLQPEHLTSNIFRQYFSLTEISFSSNYQSQSQPIFMQKGDGYLNGSFAATAYLPLNQKSRIWGEASYDNGVKYNVVWNESSDLEIIYPYVMADSIGGNMQSECYFFKGGYTQEYDRIIWGGELSYRALQEYRNIDPRPKNAVADFQIKLAVGWKFNPVYSLMLSGKAKRYKQTNDLVYYSEQGQSYTYHLTGMGFDYTRFSGTNNNISYKGTGLGTSIDLFPSNKTGYTLSGFYDFFFFEKIMNGLNYLPMVELKEQKTGFFFAWVQNKNLSKGGINASGEIKLRNGAENIFGDHANNAYPQIAKMKMYSNNIYWIRISGFFERQNERGSVWSVHPLVNLTNFSFEYQIPTREIKSNYIEPVLSFSWITPYRKILLSVKADTGYSFSFNNSTILTGMNASDKTYDLVINNTNALQSDKFKNNLRIRCDVACFRKALLFVQVLSQYQYYKAIDANLWALSVSLGIVL